MTSKRFVSMAAALAFGVAAALAPGTAGFADETTPSADPTATAGSPTPGPTSESPEPRPTTSESETPPEDPPSTPPEPPASTQPDPTPSDSGSPSPTQPDPSSSGSASPDPSSPAPSPTTPGPSSSAPSPSDSPPGSSSPPRTPPGADDPAPPDPGAGPAADPGADLYPQPPFAPVAGNPSAALMQRLYDAQTRQRSLRNQLHTTEDQLARAEDAVTAAKAALADARTTRTRALDGLHDSVRTIYKSGAPYGVYAVLGPSADAGMLRDGTYGQLATVAEASDRVDLLSDRLAAAVDNRDGLAAELADLRRSLRQADALVKRLQAETAAALARPPDTGAPAGAAPAPGAPAAGKLFLPVAGSVTSEYGNRYDPYYHNWQLHAGVDIAAATGTPVRAAAAGRVIQAGWNGGYGNYICLAHGQVRGQQLTTCYAHLSRILVAEGDTVPVGHTIGQVGSTGASTGPHLHFEVRLGGRPTDPRLWL